MKKVALMMALLAVTAQGIAKGNSPLMETQTLATESSLQRLATVAIETPDPWGQMEPVVDSLVLSMVDRGLDYDKTQAETLWTSLYYMVSIHQVSDFRVTERENDYLVPQEMMADFAYALFGEATLPEIPDTLAGFVTLEGEEYTLAKGDRPLVETMLTDCVDLGEGAFFLAGVLVSLPEDRAEICSFETTLLQGDGMFGYSVETMELQYPVG